MADALLGPWSSCGGDAAYNARPDSLRQSALRWLQQCYRLADAETGFCGGQAGHPTCSHPAGLLRVEGDAHYPEDVGNSQVFPSACFIWLFDEHLYK